MREQCDMCGPSRIHYSPAPGVQRKNFSDKNLFRFSSSFCSWDSFFVSLACMTSTKIEEGNIRKRVSECRWKSLLYPITFSLFCILAAGEKHESWMQVSRRFRILWAQNLLAIGGTFQDGECSIYSMSYMQRCVEAHLSGHMPSSFIIALNV